jgi:hypothetical protein
VRVQELLWLAAVLCLEVRVAQNLFVNLCELSRRVGNHVYEQGSRKTLCRQVSEILDLVESLLHWRESCGGLRLGLESASKSRVEARVKKGESSGRCFKIFESCSSFSSPFSRRWQLIFPLGLPQ